MSIQNFFKDIIEGNLPNAWARLLDFLHGYLPSWLVSFIDKAGTAEGKILTGLVSIAINDVKTGGFTTDSFIAAAKDVYAQLAAQNITTFTLQDIFAMLNTAASGQVPK